MLYPHRYNLSFFKSLKPSCKQGAESLFVGCISLVSPIKKAQFMPVLSIIVWYAVWRHDPSMQSTIQGIYSRRNVPQPFKKLCRHISGRKIMCRKSKMLLHWLCTYVRGIDSDLKWGKNQLKNNGMWRWANLKGNKEKNSKRTDMRWSSLWWGERINEQIGCSCKRANIIRLTTSPLHDPLLWAHLRDTIECFGGCTWSVLAFADRHLKNSG